MLASADADGLAEVLRKGLLVAVRATLDGFAVLHAGAVEVNDRAVAVLGPAGTGKSTVTAMLCAAGARLLTDDVLVLDESGGAVACRRASTQVRLRPNAASLVALFDVAPVQRQTADGRLALTLPSSPHERCPIGLVILPRPSRDAVSAVLTPVPPARAVFALLAEPRVGGLRTPEHQQRLFQGAAALAAQVPMVEAHIPWGPPWSRQAADRLLDMVRPLP